MTLSSPPRVGVLGGGQLGRMLMESANRLNIPMSILDAATAPAKQISAHDDHVTGSFAQPKSFGALAEKCDVMTAEIEHVDTFALEEIEKSHTNVRVEPHWQSIRTIQNKYEQKKHLARAGIPQVEFRELQSRGTGEDAVAELRDCARSFGYPMMLKSKTLAYDGRGNYAIKSEDDISAALEALKDRPLYVERWVPFKMEIAVIVVKTGDGCLSYPVAETVQEDSICKLVYAPARGISPAVHDAAQSIASNAVSTFDGKGVFGVELFLLEDDSLLLCELASRVHNSGHYTIEACGLSQFDAHLRAILDLPIPPQSLSLRQPAVMLNILGGKEPDSHLKLTDTALSIPNASIHLYGKGAGRPGRKMGHITVTAPTVEEAEKQISKLACDAA